MSIDKTNDYKNGYANGYAKCFNNVSKAINKTVQNIDIKNPNSVVEELNDLMAFLYENESDNNLNNDKEKSRITLVVLDMEV